MSAIAVVATVNGIIVHMIMIGRVLYGLADQGNLPAVLAVVNPKSGTPVVATLIGIAAILVLALGVPLTGLAEWTSRFTLGIFALVNLALIRIKTAEVQAPRMRSSCRCGFRSWDWRPARCSSLSTCTYGARGVDSAIGAKRRCSVAVCALMPTYLPVLPDVSNV
ncbi:amino acid permease [Bradyrhizobium guangxiense]